MKDFITPYGHVNFLAKRLFGSIGEIVDGSVAHMLPHGGGPIETHTHTHSHLFIVVKGEARIETPDGDVTIGENEI